MFPVFLKTLNYRRMTADGIVFLLYTVYTGWILVVYEWHFCDLVVGQVAMLRMMSGVPRTLLGFLFCGALEETIRRRIKGETPSLVRSTVAATLALCLFQLPIYITSALIMHLGVEQILITCGIYIAIDIVFGWSYAILLDRMRRQFGVVVEVQS